MEAILLPRPDRVAHAGPHGTIELDLSASECSVSFEKHMASDDSNHDDISVSSLAVTPFTGSSVTTRERCDEIIQVTYDTFRYRHRHMRDSYGR